MFVSPASLEVALWALLLGARGRSESDLMRAMGLLHRQKHKGPPAPAAETSQKEFPAPTTAEAAHPLEQLGPVDQAMHSLVVLLESNGSHCATGVFLNARHKVN